MALIKWSGLVSEVKGVLNGTVFSNATYGATMRNRKRTNGQHTTYWARSKKNLSVVASTWRTLTSMQVGTWESQRTSYPYSDKFGASKTPSAYQLFCTLNSNLVNMDQGIIFNALAPAPQKDIKPVALNETGGGVVSISFKKLLSADHRILVYVSPPQSAGVHSLPQRSQLIANQLSTGSGNIILTTDLALRWGELSNNQKFFFQTYILDQKTGQKYGSYINIITLTNQ